MGAFAICGHTTTLLHTATHLTHCDTLRHTATHYDALHPPKKSGLWHLWVDLWCVLLACCCACAYALETNTPQKIVSTWPKLTPTSVSISVCMYKYARMYIYVYISRRVARFPSRKSTKLRKSNSWTYHTLASNKCVPRSSLRARVWGSRLLDKGSEEGWPMGWTIGCSVCEVRMKFMLCGLCGTWD